METKASPYVYSHTPEEFSVKVPPKVASWHEEGKKAGLRVHDAETKAEVIAREYVLVYGGHLGESDDDGNLVPAANDWIAGYCSAWSNPNTQKARKTEVKAIFEAFAMGDQERTLVVGTKQKTDDKGAAILDEKNKPTMENIEETHTIREWLLMHQDVKGFEYFSGLANLARRLRGPAKGSGSSGGANRGPRAVTDKQQGEIEARVEVMSANQAHSVAQRSMAQLAKLPQFEIVQFRLIVSACDLIVNKSTNEPAKRKAAAIRDLAEDMVEQLKATLTPVMATAKITASTPAPAPASAPKGEGESTAPAQAEEKEKAA